MHLVCNYRVHLVCIMQLVCSLQVVCTQTNCRTSKNRYTAISLYVGKKLSLGKEIGCASVSVRGGGPLGTVGIAVYITCVVSQNKCVIPKSDMSRVNRIMQFSLYNAFSL